MGATERFEALGTLYYRATGYLRPGKDEPMETRRDANSPENRERFEQWLASHGWTAALDRIAQLESQLADSESEEPSCWHCGCALLPRETPLHCFDCPSQCDGCDRCKPDDEEAP